MPKLTSNHALKASSEHKHRCWHPNDEEIQINLEHESGLAVDITARRVASIDWASVKNQLQFVCIHFSVLFLLAVNDFLWLTFSASFSPQGAATAIGAGNEVKDLLNQETRQVKGWRGGFEVSGNFIGCGRGFCYLIFTNQLLFWQIEERNIELEGTRAQLRVMESKLASRSDLSPEHTSSNTNSARLSIRDGITIMHTSTPNRILPHSQTISTPSMKAMIPLVMDEAFQHSSSTESAHDQQEREAAMAKYPETPKRSKPSKIPLPGTKGFIAKPPSGRTPTTGPSSNKSLTKSTSSLYNGQKSSGPSSITRKDTSLTRPDSVQSWRNMPSFEGKSRSSSIPISNKPVISVSSSPNASSSPPVAAAYGNTTLVNIPASNHSKYVSTAASSPLPRPKRDSLTTRVKNLDSLSRLQSTSTGALSASTGILTRSPTSPNAVTNGTTNRKYTALPVRRSSNVSVGRENDVHDSAGGETNGGKVRNIRSSIWNWLKI